MEDDMLSNSLIELDRAHLVHVEGHFIGRTYNLNDRQLYSVPQG